MSSIFFIILFFVLFGAGRDRRRSDLFKVLFGVAFFGAIASVVIPPIAIVAVIALIIWLVKKYGKKNKQTDPESTYRRPQSGPQSGSQNWSQSRPQSGSQSGQQYWSQNHSQNGPQYTQNNTSYGGYHSYQGQSQWTASNTSTARSSSARAKTKSSILPRPVTKRLRIIKEFNRKYDLTLTDEQMQRIVDSSYMSEAWKLELEAMSEKYETIYEWYHGDSRYLRAYIHAFEIQEISSDIRQQEQICIRAFQQVWDYADSLFNLSLEERIARVNETYYAQFDNITFMIAYRFLEERGYKHKLDSMDLVHEESDLDKLKKKYDQAAGQMGQH